MFSDTALVQVFFVTATITAAVTGKDQNTGKSTDKQNEEDPLAKRK